jgi:hypothetical protein
METKEKPTYRLTVTMMPGSVPAINRLRSALKTLLRAFGVRCISIEELPQKKG